MLVAGLIALITAIFLGGPSEIFYVDNFEKGIKKHVVEKERKKDILKDIKNTKSIFKDFEKERKKDFKGFLNLYKEKNTSAEQLNSLFENLVTKRANFQAKIIDQRILIFNKINTDEWDNIVKSSVTVSEKRIAKVEKKASKSKGDFLKTKSKVQNMITNENKQKSILDGLNEVITEINALESILLSINTSNNKILADKNSGKTELLKIVTEESEKRNPVFKSMINFHSIAQDNSSDLEWKKIMKTFLKELQMSSR